MNMMISTKIMSTNFLPTAVEDAKEDSGESSSLFGKTGSVYKYFTNFLGLRCILFMIYDLSYIEQ